MLPYTLLIKSWRLRACASATESDSSVSNTVEYAATFMRSLIPPLLEVCKRNAKPFMAFSASHLVSMMLRVLSALLAGLSAPEERLIGRAPTSDIKVVVAYASAMALGLSLQSKARSEFSALVTQLVPEFTEVVTRQCGVTNISIFDVGLRFEKRQVSFFRWDVATAVGLQSEELDGSALSLDRRSSLAASSASIFPSLGRSGFGSHVFVSTRHSVSMEAWLTTLGSAKMHVMVVGDAASGKSRVLRNSARTLKRSQHFETSTLQMGQSLSPRAIQSAVEAGLSRKLKAVYCPGAGTQAVLVILENLNLDTEVGGGSEGYTRIRFAAFSLTNKY